MGFSASICLFFVYYYIVWSLAQDKALPETILCLVWLKCCSELKFMDPRGSPGAWESVWSLVPDEVRSAVGLPWEGELHKQASEKRRHREGVSGGTLCKV